MPLLKNSALFSTIPNGNRFMGLNGGQMYQITERVSFVVECESQEEIDYYWEKLTEGGEESIYGWLKDKYGVSWQIIPAISRRERAVVLR
ncbi:MAG: hypothetical protein EOM90_11865 [Alphaproteobacteria bacterium]|nr:hypothetical protein [Alphaproteobacteria bacterium]